MRKLLWFLLTLAPFTAHGAITFGTDSHACDGNEQNYEVSHACASGTDLLIMALSTYENVKGTDTCVWDPTGANESGTVAASTSASRTVLLCYVNNPTCDGTAKTVSFSGVDHYGDGSDVYAVDVTGTDATTPVSNGQATAACNPSPCTITHTGGDTGDYMVAVLSGGVDYTATTNGQTAIRETGSCSTNWGALVYKAWGADNDTEIPALEGNTIGSMIIHAASGGGGPSVPVLLQGQFIID